MKKKILFIGPRYFDYYKSIIQEFEKHNYEVDYFEDIAEGTIDALCKKLGLYDYWRKISFNKLLTKISNKDYDILFVIGGKHFSYEQWDFLISTNKFNQKFLYQWDSLQNYDYRNLIPLFDRTFSFDRKDCVKLGITYLPLFYKDCVRDEDILDIDLLFVGIFHSDRLSVLSAIYHQAINNNLKCYFKVYYPFPLYFLLRIKHGKKMKSPFWIFKKIKGDKMTSLYRKAKCIVDISHPDQSGLTMRTIESIGAGKKLLTSNNNIVLESFYSDKNIQIFSRSNPNIDFTFLKTQYQYPNIEEFSLSSWVLKIINS